MVRLSDFCTFTLLAIGLTTGCSSDQTATYHATGGNTGTSFGEGGNPGSSLGGGGMTSSSTGGVGDTRVATSGGAGLGGGPNTSTGGTQTTGSSHYGQLQVYSVSLSPQTIAAVTYASFYTAGPMSCTQTFQGCVVHDSCSQQVSYLSAGTLRLTSAATSKLPANDVTMTPNADNTYDQGYLSGMFSGQEVLHVSASGAAVPAFSADLTAPLALLIDSPAPDSSGAIQASASDDLTIHFSRGTTGVTLSAQSFVDGALSLECNSEPGSNSLTIPKAALALGAGAINLFTRSTTEIVAGEFAITAGIVMNAYTPDKVHPVTIVLN